MFYVYVYLDPRKSGKYVYGKYKFEYEPFYVGKGHGDRYYDHINRIDCGRNELKKNKIKKILRETGKEPIVEFVERNINEDVAWKLETQLIKTIGRIDLKEGCLTNMTDGGEGPFGVIRDKENREKISKGLKKWYSENEVSEETREKLSKAHKGRKMSFTEEGLRSKREHVKCMHNEEVWKKISDSLKVKMKGEGNSFYGKHHSEETKNILREKNSGSKHTSSEKFILISPSGERIIIDGLREFCRNNSFNRGTLKNTLKTKKPLSSGKNKGYMLEYYNEI